MYGAKGYQRRVKRNILIGIENIYVYLKCFVLNHTV